MLVYNMYQYVYYVAVNIWRPFHVCRRTNANVDLFYVLQKRYADLTRSDCSTIC